MCGNDISVIPVPSQDFIQFIQSQIAKGIIKIHNKEIEISQIYSVKNLNFASIVVLEISHCKLNSDTLKAFATLNWQNLTKLNLSNNLIGPQGCQVISETLCFSKLLILQIDKNKIQDEGLAYLTQSSFKERLEDLSINDNGISNGGVSVLGKVFKRLHCFSIGGNDLSDQGIKELKVNLNLEKLIFLKLSRNQITDNGLNSLLESQNLHQLQVLLVQRNKITKTKKQFKSKKNISKDLFLFY